MRWSMLVRLTCAGALLAALPAAARALDLPAAWREAAAANPSLAARREMVDAARQRVGPAGAWQSPMLEFGAINVPAGGGFGEDPMTMKMVGISQTVPLFGAKGLNRRSAESAAAAEGAAFDQAQADLYSQIWIAYADAYYADQLIRTSRAHQGELDQLVRSAQARYESGNGRLEDVLRAQAERAERLADLVGFQAESRSAHARLAGWMGRGREAPLDSLAAPPAVKLSDEPDAWLAALTPAHPRLREQQAQVDRYLLGARAARRMAWPDLELNGSYGFREPIAGIEQDNMWSATVQFMVPIFARQGPLSEGASMEAMARAGESDLRAARLDLEQQVVAVHAQALANQRTVSLLADTVLVTQRRAVEASWSAYRAGSTDLWRVFEAMHSLYGEDIALIQARRDLARAGAELLGITARGDLLGVTLPSPGGNR